MDNIDHPQHYKSHVSGTECIEIVRYLPYSLGNAIKYLWRAGLKNNNLVEDYKKALWYLKDFFNVTNACINTDYEIILLKKLEYVLQFHTDDLLFIVLSNIYETLKRGKVAYRGLDYDIKYLERMIAELEQAGQDNNCLSYEVNPAFQAYGEI